MAVEQAAVILCEHDGDLNEAREHVASLLAKRAKPLSLWLRVLWCLTPQGQA